MQTIPYLLSSSSVALIGNMDVVLIDFARIKYLLWNWNLKMQQKKMPKNCGSISKF